MPDTTFKVEITFSGVCSFVPRDTTSGVPLAYCVVLPNAWTNVDCPGTPLKVSSVDRVSTLVPHRPILLFPPDRLASATSPPGATAVYPLEGKQILFAPDPATEPLKDANLPGLTSFKELSMGSTEALFTAKRAVLNPNPCRVATHVLIEHGTLTCPPKGFYWSFDSSLRTAPAAPKILEHRVLLTYTNLRTFTVSIAELGTHASLATLSFPAEKQSSDLMLEIKNTCLVNPLDWKHAGQKKRIVPDDDFRWHYEILDDLTGIREALSGLPCPIPRPSPVNPNGAGFNCFSCLLKPTAFDPEDWYHHVVL